MAFARSGRRRARSGSLLLACLLSIVAPPAHAADQTVLGNRLVVKNPGAPTKRTIVAVAKEASSPNTIVGTPTTGGATLTIAVDGGTPSSQTFALPAGTSAATRKPFWSGDATRGFKYKDAKGENGPVKVAQLKLKKGVFQITAVAQGKLGTISVLPPNAGTGGCVTLEIGGGDAYSVLFAGAVTNKSAKLFKVAKVTQEGVCRVATTTTTITTSTSLPTDTTTTTPPATSTTTTTTTGGSTTSTTMPPNEELCATLSPLPSGTCAVTAGGAELLLEGDVLAPATVYRGGQVLVDADGVITCVGCDCAAAAPGATRVTCPAGAISPGLVNAADHITFTQNAPASDSGERYDHRHQWRTGSGMHTPIVAPGGATANQIRWGELRFLMGGATSTISSGSGVGLVRNLDRSNASGLDLPAVDLDTFPLGDSSGAQLTSGCGYPDITTAVSIASDAAYVAVAGEGVSASARNELACLTSSANGGEDLAQPQTSFSKSIALTAATLALMAERGTGLVWTPRSNVRLYGNTAAVRAAAALGVEIALGTDWTATGSMNVLRELRCAAAFNQTYLDGFFSDRDLWLMATRHPARLAAADSLIGSLEVGKLADVAIFSAATHDAHRAVLEADPEDVVLVLRKGQTLYGDQGLVTALAGAAPCDALDVCGVQKAVCLSDEIGVSLATLEASVAGVYPAYFCDTPTNEPTCTPSRSASVSGSTIYTGVPSETDADGDGIADASDACPAVFDPIRPMDAGVQADADGDGVGDACDPCPLLPDVTECGGS